MPQNISPMLAQLGKGPPPATEDWLYEVKWDGVRAICYIDAGAVRMVSRNGHSMERQYPELSVLPHHIEATSAILDGEIAALDPRGLPSFELLQRRITVADASAIATLARKLPVVFFAFDLLYLDGRDLRGLPLIERKRLLKEILKPGDLVRYSDDFPGKGGQTCSLPPRLRDLKASSASARKVSTNRAGPPTGSNTRSRIPTSSSCADSPKASATCSAPWFSEFTTADNSSGPEMSARGSIAR